MAAAEKGRSAIALHNDGAALEELGNYLRTLALRTDETYRDKDGIVLSMFSIGAGGQQNRSCNSQRRIATARRTRK